MGFGKELTIITIIIIILILLLLLFNISPEAEKPTKSPKTYRRITII